MRSGVANPDYKALFGHVMSLTRSSRRSAGSRSTSARRAAVTATPATICSRDDRAGERQSYGTACAPLSSIPPDDGDRDESDDAVGAEPRHAVCRGAPVPPRARVAAGSYSVDIRRWVVYSTVDDLFRWGRAIQTNRLFALGSIPTHTAGRAPAGWWPLARANGAVGRMGLESVCWARQRDHSGRTGNHVRRGSRPVGAGAGLSREAAHHELGRTAARRASAQANETPTVASDRRTSRVDKIYPLTSALACSTACSGALYLPSARSRCVSAHSRRSSTGRPMSVGATTWNVAQYDHDDRAVAPDIQIRDPAVPTAPFCSSQRPPASRRSPQPYA